MTRPDSTSSTLTASGLETRDWVRYSTSSRMGCWPSKSPRHPEEPCRSLSMTGRIYDLLRLRLSGLLGGGLGLRGLGVGCRVRRLGGGGRCSPSRGGSGGLGGGLGRSRRRLGGSVGRGRLGGRVVDR